MINPLTKEEENTLLSKELQKLNDPTINFFFQNNNLPIQYFATEYINRIKKIKLGRYKPYIHVYSHLIFGLCKAYYFLHQDEEAFSAINKYLSEIKTITNQLYCANFYPLLRDVSTRLYEKTGLIKYDKKAQIASDKDTFYKRTPIMGIGISLFCFKPITKYLLSNLINNEITVSSPSTFNDPFDCLALKWAEVNPKSIHQRTSFKHFRIACFSQSSKYPNNDIDLLHMLSNQNKPKYTAYRNILMWSHYADSHKGICIKYNFSPDFACSNEENYSYRNFKTVKYVNSKISIKEPTISEETAFLTKLKCWKYEKEIRLLDYDCNYEGLYKSIRLDNSSKIEAIYFGVRCDEKDIKTIMDIIKLQYPKCNFYQMKENPMDIYKLNISKIN